MRAIHGLEKNDPSLAYALNEISDLRQLVRSLLAQSPSSRTDANQTLGSFDYQWDRLSDGINMLSDHEFRAKSRSEIVRLTTLPTEWFPGKRVLDAGCGNGRWSEALCALGADVLALDASAAGVRQAQQACAAYSKFKSRFSAHQHDLLEPISEKDFDLVWCFGVAHHTGDTARAIGNACAAVKPGGYLFAMIYGEPTTEAHFIELNNYTMKRRELAGMDFDERVAFLRQQSSDDLLNAWFDGLSPQINDLHRFDEITAWLSTYGFEKPTRTSENRNHHFIARKN
jgi:2-polyprenyl-3-methyl-5-hydroxy-6-metoxy-1,4-benzoquinol methylase